MDGWPFQFRHRLLKASTSPTLVRVLRPPEKRPLGLTEELEHVHFCRSESERESPWCRSWRRRRRDEYFCFVCERSRRETPKGRLQLTCALHHCAGKEVVVFGDTMLVFVRGWGTNQSGGAAVYQEGNLVLIPSAPLVICLSDAHGEPKRLRHYGQTAWMTIWRHACIVAHRRGSCSYSTGSTSSATSS